MNRARIWPRSLKALHEAAALGLGGGLAACLAIHLGFQDGSPERVLAAREGFDAVARYVVVPSLGATVLSGLLSIAATRAFHDAGWAWVKALLGLPLFEATLMTVGASRRREEWLTAAADPAQLATLMTAERNTLLVLIGICVANIVLAVWRPRMTITIR